MICPLLLSMLSIAVAQPSAVGGPAAAESLAIVAARADELVNCVQQCPFDVLHHPKDNHLEDYIRSRNLYASEFYLGETLYFMKLFNVIDLRDIDSFMLSKLIMSQRMLLLEKGPSIPPPSPDAVRVLCNQIMAYALMTDYGGAPEAYRFWLLRQLPIFPRAKGESIDAFLNDCTPIRSSALDTMLARLLLSSVLDVRNIGELCKSRQLVQKRLPEGLEPLFEKLSKSTDGKGDLPLIQDAAKVLISHNSPALDVVAARLVLLYMDPASAESQWREFMVSRAPAELRLKYLWWSCENDSSNRPVWERKAETLKEAIALGVGGGLDFELMRFNKGEEFQILNVVVCKNDMTAALMRGLGGRWAAQVDAGQSKEYLDSHDFVRKMAANDDLLYYALCAIVQYVNGVRKAVEPESDRVISEILNRAVTSPDMKTALLARIIKQRAISYGRLLSHGPGGSTGWSFVEPATHRTGIDMVDYIYLMNAPD